MHFGSLFEDQVRIGSTETKAAQSGRPRTSACGPVLPLRRNHNREIIPRNVGIGVFQVKMWRNLSMLQRKNDFHQPRNSSSCFQMPDIGFDRTDRQWIIGFPTLP